MTPAVRAVVVVALAIIVDLCFGDPTNRWHPVAWLGRLLGAGTKRLMLGSSWRLMLSGGLLTLAVAVFAGAVAWGVSRLAVSLGIVGVVIDAVTLKMLMTLRSLARAARHVADDLGRGDLAAARASVGRHLVSRRTAELDAEHVASATVESVAENLADGFIGPLCFYLVFGLPGAAIYRAVNTADSMIGYRDGCLEYFGKVAARLDDALNLVPARIAGCVIVVGAAIVGERAAAALRIMMRDAGRTASPNAGWPMAAMAGALGVTLEKPHVYRLGDGALPSAPDLHRSVVVMLAAAVFVAAVALAVRLAIP